MIKILERIIQTRVEINERVNDISISKKQVGFVKGLGCDVNIMRLRQRVHDVKELGSKDEKYIFFIDLKAAYDSVDHNRLFNKMQMKRYCPSIVNAVRKIYSSAKMRLNTLQKQINVNRGVLQGGILSPWLFNIYIDDLIRDLENKAFEVLGYADDLAIICKSKKELDIVIDALELWSIENGIEVNKKKSGILIIDNDRNDMHKHRGYPIKKNYKYLGITINNNISPREGLEQLNKKLEVYLARSTWINRKFFTPKSLMSLAGYYQHSRLVYGMSCFLDDKKLIEYVESGCMKYVKAILGLKNQVNSNRLRVILNAPLNRHNLWALMRKTRRKYKEHFGEEPWIYNKADHQYETWVRSFGQDKLLDALTLEKCNYGTFKKFINTLSITSLAMEDGITLGVRYRLLHRTKYFKAWDKRDYYLIRYLVNHGFFKERFIPLCEHCGEENSRKHVTNDCPAFESVRAWTWGKLQERRTLSKYKGDLEYAILDVYFNPVEDCHKDLDILRGFAMQLTIKNCQTL